MRVARDRLIFLALCALDEIVDRAEHGPVQPGFGLRLALAFLFAMSDGRERASYDAFWRCVTPRKEPHREHRLYYEFAGNHLRAIAASLGIDFEIELREAINRARGLPPGHRSLTTTLWNAAAAEREAGKERARGRQGTGAPREILRPRAGGAVREGAALNQNSGAPPP